MSAEQGNVRPEGREGMVTVYDSNDRYLGCMGRETWERMLTGHAEQGNVAVLRAFCTALAHQREWLSEADMPYPDPIFRIRTKPGFIFDDSFWDVFHSFPFHICHVAYYGPERVEPVDHTTNPEGVFELRWTTFQSREKAGDES